VAASSRVIGVDESGKGDFFGPLVIAAFLAPDSDLDSLTALAVVVVGPEKYNQLYDKIRNLNKLLAWGHARAIENILEKTEADSAVSDKFGKPELIQNALMEKGRGLALDQIVRGESVLQVAAASIIARAAFVRQMDALSDEYGLTIPRGAGPQVDQAGRALVSKHGPKVLDKLAKKHFKNFARALSPKLFS